MGRNPFEGGFGIIRRDLIKTNDISREDVMSERVIKDYHAHIYYDPKTTRDAAAKVRAGLAQFNVQLGGWHDEAVGPHLDAMYQAVFTQEEFAKVVPWLMLHREGLSVLVHPSTGDGYGDHMERSLWLGDRLKLNEAAFKRGH
jgi:aromatic ring-cleaving dioxygenase